jgi:hypothetical protein
VNDSREIAGYLRDQNFRAAFFESHEIIECCLSLQTISSSVEIPQGTLRKLRASTSLSYREARESSEQDDSRPTFFELFVAAKLIRAGLPVGFTANDEDVVTTFENHKVFIECKRVASPKKFYENINKGNIQLTKRYTKGRRMEFGLVFVSISDLMNPNFDLLTASNLDAAIADSNERIKPYVDRVFELITRHGWPDKKTVAYFVHAALPYVLNNGQSVLYRRLTHFSSYFHAGGNFPQLQEVPKRRLNYYSEFERLRKQLWREI